MGEILVHDVARPQEAAGLHEEDENQHEVRQERAHAGQGNGQELGEGRGGGHVEAEPGQHIGPTEMSSTTAKVCTRPMISEAMKQPAREPESAEDHHHEHDGAHGDGHGRLGHEIVAADHPGQPGEGGAAREHDGEHAGHVVAESADHLGMGEGGLDDETDAGAGEEEPDGHDIRAEISSMKPR